MLKQAYVLFLPMILSLSTGYGCSFAPRETLQQTAEAVGLRSQIQLRRERPLRLSSLSHLGLFIPPAAELSTSISPALQQHLRQAMHTSLAQHFSQVTLLQGSQPLAGVTRQMDYVLAVTQLQTATAFQTTAPQTTPSKIKPPQTNDMPTVATPATSSATAAIKPLIMSLQLLDARTGKTRDTVRLQARPGALTAERGYVFFIQQVLAVYLDSL
ncbi:MAG: hypothetical protein KTR20_04080 [Cellvibrionaceae bacterium]|nr:hypothetical protein [Cellvibrionaceae bacterium]